MPGILSMTLCLIRRQTMRKANTEPPGFIQGDSLYTLDEIERRLGLKQWARKEAAKKGLRIKKIGRKSFILGRDVIAFFDDQPEE